MSRRIKGFIVTGSHVAMLCNNGMASISVVDSAPETAKFENAIFDYMIGAFVIVMSDDTFDIVPLGSQIPISFTNTTVSYEKVKA